MQAELDSDFGISAILRELSNPSSAVKLASPPFLMSLVPAPLSGSFVSFSKHSGALAICKCELLQVHCVSVWLAPDGAEEAADMVLESVQCHQVRRLLPRVALPWPHKCLELPLAHL